MHSARGLLAGLPPPCWYSRHELLWYLLNPGGELQYSPTSQLEHEHELSGQSPIPILKPEYRQGTLLFHYRSPWKHTFKIFSCCLSKAAKCALFSTPSNCLAQASRWTQSTLLDYPALMANRADSPELHQIITTGKTFLGRPSIPGPCTNSKLKQSQSSGKKAHLLSL